MSDSVVVGPLVLLLATGLAACRVSLDQEELQRVEFSQATQTCVVTSPPGVDRGGAFSLSFAQGSYWVYGETWVEGGAILNSSGALVPVGADPCTGGTPVLDPLGILLPLIALTAEEQAHNANPPDGRRIALWPLSGFVFADQGWIFYRKVRLRDYFDIVDTGVGIARLRWGEAAERVATGLYAQEPTLLWLAPQLGWGIDALLAPDSYVYVYGCYQRAPWDTVCRVARVAPEQASEPTAYHYFDGESWVPQIERAAVVVQNTQTLSLSFNPHLGTYLFLHPGYLDNRVYGFQAEQPWGGFLPEHLLYEGLAPETFWISDVRQHPALAIGNHSRIVTSYYTRPSNGPAGMRLVEVLLR